MNARRPILSALAVVLGVLVLGSAPALAASPPVLGETSVLEVSGDSATLQAEVNPEGAETAYRFEYGTSEAYGQSAPSPEGQTGAGSAHADGAGSASRVCSRAPPITSVSSPAARAGRCGGWMRRSPRSAPARSGCRTAASGKWSRRPTSTARGSNSSLMKQNGEGLTQAAANGDALAYETASPTELEPVGFANTEEELATAWRRRLADARSVASAQRKSGPRPRAWTRDPSLLERSLAGGGAVGGRAHAV